MTREAWRAAGMFVGLVAMAVCVADLLIHLIHPTAPCLWQGRMP